MGNLIIKPNTGGLLKLQDEGGTDAISISTTGNTTLAGTANALGTVTSGDISHADIVYPAGHCLGIESIVSVETNALSTSYNTYLSDNIITKGANSNIYIILEMSYGLNLVGSGFGVRIVRGSTVIHTSGGGDGTGPHTWYTQTGTVMGYGVLSFLDTANTAAKDTTLTYHLQARKYSSGTVDMPDSGGTYDGELKITLMEFAV